MIGFLVFALLSVALVAATMGMIWVLISHSEEQHDKEAK